VDNTIMGLASFLGIKKFGQGIASAARTVTGQVNNDIKAQQDADLGVQKLLYVARNEKDPEKKTRLIKMAERLQAPNIGAEEIDPGISLSNKEVLGSAANVGLNILTPGAFKGAKAAVIGKNAAMGAAYGTAAGLEQNRGLSGTLASATQGAVLGGGMAALGFAAKAVKEFATHTTPTKLMNTAVKPSLDELRKNIKFGTDTLGEQLLKEGVSGGPKKLLEVADQRLGSLEDDLQTLLGQHSDKTVSASSLKGYVKGLLDSKGKVPGSSGDISQIKAILDDLPAEMTLGDANEMKRAIYQELRDTSYALDANLSVKKKTLKAIAKGLKQEIEDATGDGAVQEINRRLSIYGRLEDRIVTQMAQSARKSGLTLADMILGAGGAVTMNPAVMLSTLATMGAKHAANSTVAKTTAANALYKAGAIGTGAAARTAKEVGRRAIFNLP
jgi:hypothetical protein